MGNQYKQWTTMLLLTTTLLFVQSTDETNESYETNDRSNDEHGTVDKRNILFYRKPILVNKEKSYTIADDPNSMANKENESALTLLDKQTNRRGVTNNSNIGTQEIKNETYLQSEDKFTYIESNDNNSLHNEKDTEREIKMNEYTFNKSPEVNKPITTSTNKSYSENRNDNNKVKINESRNVSGKDLHFIEEVHVYEEDVDDEILIEVIDEDDKSDRSSVTHLYLEERTLNNAVEFGIKSVEELFNVKEPMWYKMGLFLDRNDPASKVAAFGTPNEMALKLSKFGFLALEASKKIAESFPQNVSRQAAGFPGSFHPRLLQDQCPLKGNPRCPPASRRYRTADGTCNNLEQPWKGSAMLPMQRFLPPVYEDGVQSIRLSVFGSRLPSTRDISVTIHRDRNHEIPTVTLMFMQWGQFIDHDITSVVKSRSFNGSIPMCCGRGGREMLPPELTHPSCLPIEVSADDWFLGQFGIRCMEFIRSAPSTRVNCDLGWREQINQVTPYIDASTIYGSDIETSDSIRTFRNGKIIYGRPHNQGPLQPPDPPGGELCRSGALTEDCFQTGDGRVSEQPGLTALHTVWVRFHNRIATVLFKLNPHWSDEKIFQETRKITYSLIQHITYREFLPIVLGPEVMELFELNLVRKGYYEQYKSKVNPAIANSFSTAAYRFGHSMVQNSFVRADHKHRPLFNNVTLHEEFDNIENIWSFGSVDRLLLGFVNQPSQRRDEFVCDELSNHLFQSSNAPFGMDLSAINIQRGRDHGIPPYTAWREPCGLSPVKTWQDLESIFNSGSVKRFQLVYRHVDDIDLYSGGLAEKPVRGGVVGPTFACIIAQQFLNLRKGDRFWFENGGFESSFTPAQLQQIRHVTFSQVLCQTMDEIETLQPFVFLSHDNQRNVRLPCDSPLINNLDLTAWAERDFEDIDNKIDFDFKRESLDNLQDTENFLSDKIKRHINEKTTAKPKSKVKSKNKKIRTEAPLKIKIANVTSSTVKLENKYGASQVAVNSVPARPTFDSYRPQTYYTQNDETRVTYLLGIAPPNTTPLPTTPPQKPIEVNIKIQYYLPTTEKTTTSRPTRKKTARPINRPANFYGQDNTILITQRPTRRPPSTKPPDLPYPVFSAQNYDTIVVRPNDFFEKPINTKRPTYSNTNNKPSYNRPSNYVGDVYEDYRPTINAYRPSNDYNTDIYSYNDRTTTRRPIIIRPQTYYQTTGYDVIEETIFEDQPFSTSKRPYIYRPDSNHYVYTDIYTKRPQQTNYNDEISSSFYNYNNKPTIQNDYNKDGAIADIYAQLLDDPNRVSDIPKKPIFFGQFHDNGPTKRPSKISNPNRIYSLEHVHKLDSDDINDKLDFKTRLITKHKDHFDNDKKFVKISSVKAEAFVNDKDVDIYSVQRRDGDADLTLLETSEINGDKIRVVDIDVSPSEVKDDHWLVYNATEEAIPLLQVPEVNLNVSCSDELPKPMKRPKVFQKLQVKEKRNTYITDMT